MSTQDKIVYHVALLLPKEIAQLSIDLNRQLVAPEGAAQFQLDTEKRPPHITLGVGAVTVDKLEEIHKKFEKLADKYKDFSLEISGVYKKRNSGLGITISDGVMSLHDDVMVILNQYRVEEVLAEYFYNEEVDDGTLNHVTIFDKERAHGDYFPHVTLGEGILPDNVETDLPATIKPSMLAVGQMGRNGCFMKRFKEFEL
jgi:2'-5' RNA ligase